MQDLKLKVNKEASRAKEAFDSLTVKDDPRAKDLYELALSYYNDALHFKAQEKFFEAFELFSYLWGLLDAGARLGLFDPGAARKHFKIEQGS